MRDERENNQANGNDHRGKISRIKQIGKLRNPDPRRKELDKKGLEQIETANEVMGG